MAKELKQMIVDELAGRYDGMDRCVVVDLTGLKAVALGEVRSELTRQNITISVVKNSLAIRALSQVGLEQLGGLLDGPSALATGGEDVLELVKALVDCAGKNEKLTIRGALADGAILERPQTVQLSRIPSRDVLTAQFLSMMQAPTSGLVRLMSGVIRNFLGALVAIRDKDETEQ